MPSSFHMDLIRVYPRQFGEKSLLSASMAGNGTASAVPDSVPSPLSSGAKQLDSLANQAAESEDPMHACAIPEPMKAFHGCAGRIP